MKRLVTIALLAAIGAAHADPSPLTMRGLLQQLMDNPKSLVMVKYQQGHFWAGAISEVGDDVFCVTSEMRKPPEDRPIRCFPYSVVTGVERPRASQSGEIMTIWVMGSDAIL